MLGEMRQWATRVWCVSSMHELRCASLPSPAARWGELSAGRARLALPQSFSTRSRPSLTLSGRSCAAEPPWPPWTSSRARAPAAAGCSRPMPGPGVAMASRGQATGCLPAAAGHLPPEAVRHVSRKHKGEGSRFGIRNNSGFQMRTTDSNE